MINLYLYCATHLSSFFSLLYSLRSFPFLVLGPYCSIGLVTCLNCVATYLGGQNMQFVGVGLSVVFGVRIAGVIANFELGQINVTDSADLQAALADVDWPPAVANRKVFDVIRLVAPNIHNTSANPPSTNLAPGSSNSMASSSSGGDESNLGNQTSSSSTSSSTGGGGGPIPIIGPGDGGGGRRLLSSEGAAFSLVPAASSVASSLHRRLLAGTSDVHESTDLAVEFQPSGYRFVYTLSSLVFYSSDPCISVGQWKFDAQGNCLPCPTGQ